MATQAEIDAMSDYLGKRRNKVARAAAQGLGAYGGVAGQGENAAEALARRPMYPDVKSAFEKSQESMQAIKEMGDLEKGYYDTSMQSLDARFRVQAQSYMGAMQTAARSREVSAQLAAAGKYHEATLLLRQADTMQRVDSQTEALFRKWDSASSVDVGGGPSAMESWYMGTLPESSQAMGSDDIRSQETRAHIETAVTNALQSGAVAPEDRAIAINSMRAAAQLGGHDLLDVARSVGGEAAEALVTQYIVDADGWQNAKRKELDTALARVDQVGVRADDADAALDKVQGIGDEVYGTDPDAEEGAPEFMPGMGIIPDSDAMERYAQVLEAIEAQPEADPAVLAKQEILASDAFSEYKNSRGYESMDEGQVFREYTREMKGAIRGRKKDFRKKKRENIESGIAKARFGDVPQKPTPPTDGAEVAAGSDVG